MRYSLLYLRESSKSAGSVSEKALFDLSVDRVFARICTDTERRERFLQVLAHPLCDMDAIIYRQDILKDFVSSSELIERLLSISLRFRELEASHKALQREARTLKRAGTASRDASKNILQAQSLCLKRALMFVKAFGEALCGYDLHSKGLLALRSFCTEMYGKKEYAELVKLCTKYESFSERGYWDFRFVFNDDGYIESYDLTDHRFIRITDPELKRKGLSFRRKREESYPCARLYPKNDGYFDSLAVSALSELSMLFSGISEQIFDSLGSLDRELEFYSVALKYIDALCERNAPISYPVISNDGEITVRTLYDTYLLISGKDISHIVPNDLILGAGGGGMLVFGDNGSGKTVYLRSVATMQILAAAGLPIPCTSAKIALFSKIATHFSESEDIAREKDCAGRFEAEVRKLSQTVDELVPGTFVFLNEVFQSTDYSEGAEALIYLLEHFSAMNIRWMLVSHLTQLENRLSPTDVTVRYATENYKIK